MENEISSPSALPQLPAMLPGPVALLKEAWVIYTKKFKTLIGIEIVPAIILIVAGLLLGGGGMALDGSRQALGGTLLVVGIILILAGIVIQVWSQVALLVVVKNDSEDLGVKTAFKKASPLFGSYFWISILSGVITVVGFILLIVPGIIFVVWFLLASYVFIDEGDRGMKALRKSKAYVKGYWGAVAWRLAFIVILTIVANMVINFVFALIRLPQLGSLVTNVLSFVFGPLFVAYFYLLYRHLKQIKGPVTLAQ